MLSTSLTVPPSFLPIARISSSFSLSVQATRFSTPSSPLNGVSGSEPLPRMRATARVAPSAFSTMPSSAYASAGESIRRIMSGAQVSAEARAIESAACGPVARISRKGFFPSISLAMSGAGCIVGGPLADRSVIASSTIISATPSPITWCSRASTAVFPR